MVHLKGSGGVGSHERTLLRGYQGKNQGTPSSWLALFCHNPMDLMEFSQIEPLDSLAEQGINRENYVSQLGKDRVVYVPLEAALRDC